MYNRPRIHGAKYLWTGSKLPFLRTIQFCASHFDRRNWSNSVTQGGQFPRKKYSINHGKKTVWEAESDILNAKIKRLMMIIYWPLNDPNSPNTGKLVESGSKINHFAQQRGHHLISFTKNNSEPLTENTLRRPNSSIPFLPSPSNTWWWAVLHRYVGYWWSRWGPASEHTPLFGAYICPP